MDLELALGRPVSDMTERAFARWRLYAQTKGLPQRRIELYLANIAAQITRVAGGDADTADFLFEPARDAQGRLSAGEKDDTEDIEAYAQAWA